MWNRQDSQGLRDIIARTTCAKGQKRFKQSFSLHATHVPDTVLGYRITNHSFVASPERNFVVITGQYDGHVWYAYDRGNQTCVEKKTVCYTEHLPVVDLEGVRLCVGEYVEASVVKEPRILDVHVRRGMLEMSAVLEFYAEIVGEAKLWVKVFEPPEGVEDKKGEDFADDEDFADFSENEEEFLDTELS
ncbi:MAG: outer spore coat protein CotE [Peptococcaceae bacterium]|nr:outer spore coat protein CotE [Peptococcaceae bacterium]